MRTKGIFMSFFKSLLGPPDIDTLESRRDIDGLIKALDYDSKKETGSQPIRCHAATALGSLGDPRAVPPLIKRLNDDIIVSGEAAWALGKIGDARAVEPLIQYISNPDPEKCGFRGKHAWALGSLGDAKATDSLIRLLSEDRYYLDKDFIKYILTEKKCAAWALGTLGDKKAIEPLRSIFTITIEDLVKDYVAKGGKKMDINLKGDPHLVAQNEFHEVKKEVGRALFKLGLREDVLCSICTYSDDTFGVERSCRSKFQKFDYNDCYYTFKPKFYRY